MAQVVDAKLDAGHPELTNGFPPTPPQESTLWCSGDKDFDLDPSLLESPSFRAKFNLELSSTSISDDEDPVVAVIGVGYVGTHLVGSFSSRYQVIGFDVSEQKVSALREEHKELERASFSCRPSDLVQATHFLISVPTLLRPDKTIDSSYLRDALKTVGAVARRGSTIIIESSVAVGMTRQLLGPLAASHGFFAGMSPERVDPGRVEPPMRSIPKVISGLDNVVPGSLDAISRLYTTIFERVVPVSKPEVAEMMKLYENCQRMMCIAYANEMADACIPLGIDPYEVCDVASTKPFGYMPYAPGVGVGGHCIPVNPFYLLSNCEFPLLESAAKAMHNRPAKIANRILARLRGRRTKEIIPRVLVVGMGFKAGQSHLSNSPGLDLARHLAVSMEVDVCWADALVKQEAIPQIPRLPEDAWCKPGLEEFDVIVVASKQQDMDLELLDGLEGVEVERWCR